MLIITWYVFKARGVDAAVMSMAYMSCIKFSLLCSHLKSCISQ